MLDPLEKSWHLARHIHPQKQDDHRHSNKQKDHDQNTRQVENNRTTAQHASALGSPTRLNRVRAGNQHGVRDGAFFNGVSEKKMIST